MMQALLFDMDGVLLNSSQVHTRAFSQAFNACKIDIPFNYFDFSGMSTEDVMNSIIDKHGLPKVLFPKLVKSKREFARSLFLESGDSLLYPRVKEGLENLSKKYRLALCTSGSKTSAEVLFSIGVKIELFDCVFTAESVKNSKPDPEIYLLAMEKLGLEPTDCIVIEDSLAGIAAGLKAGADVVQIGTEKVLDVNFGGDNSIIFSATSFSEFLDWIMENGK
jgi:HAD superfamily hydrolase (TIGR01509 family)